MHSALCHKTKVHNMRPTLLGGRVQIISENGQLHELRRHKMHGLHIQPRAYPLSFLTDVRTDVLPSQTAQPSAAPKRTQQSTKRKLSSILRGGSLAPL